MHKNVTLFIIDPQTDFCNPNGALYVPGAEKDITRLSTMIKKNIGDIHDIQMTLDSHHVVHIAHPIFWVNSKGDHPTPFTVISADDVRKGTWRTTDPSKRDYGKVYTETLESNGKYQLMIWPPHCLIGSVGQTVMPELLEVVNEWEAQYAIAGKHTKGSNPYTEHYSAIQADVVDPADHTTQPNMHLINTIINCADESEVVIAGEALSHCVASTFRDTAKYLSPAQLEKCTILVDACSSVPGCDSLSNQFLDDMTKVGVKVSTTDKFF